MLAMPGVLRVTQPNQEFRYNTSSLQIVHKTSGHCVDLDTSSFLVELYPCNSPVSANQQWNLTSHGKVGATAEGDTSRNKGNDCSRDSQ